MVQIPLKIQDQIHSQSSRNGRNTNLGLSPACKTYSTIIQEIDGHDNYFFHLHKLVVMMNVEVHEDTIKPCQNLFAHRNNNRRCRDGYIHGI